MKKKRIMFLSINKDMKNILIEMRKDLDDIFLDGLNMRTIENVTNELIKELNKFTKIDLQRTAIG